MIKLRSIDGKSGARGSGVEKKSEHSSKGLRIVIDVDHEGKFIATASIHVVISHADFYCRFVDKL